MKKRLLVLLPVIGLLFSCSGTKEITWEKVNSSSTYIKSTLNSLVKPFNTQMMLAYSNENYSDEKKNEIKNTYLNEVIRLHKIFDRHYYYADGDDLVTNVKTINYAYGTGEKVYCSNELYDLLKQGVRMCKVTNGKYNFFAGKIVSFWDDILTQVCDGEDVETLDPYYLESQKEEQNKLLASIPTLEECSSLLTFFDEEKAVIFNAVDDITYNGVTLERSTRTSLYRPEITPGGIAKGLATDLLKEKLNSINVYKGYLNSGTSSICSLLDTKYLPKGYQTIGVTNPNSLTREKAFSIKLYGSYNLSTSGNYSSGTSYKIKDENDKYIYRHHIIDLITGEPSSYHASVSLISTNFTSCELDALSTAYINTPSEELKSFTEELLNQHQGYDLSYIVMDNDGDNIKVIASKDYQNKIINDGKVDISYE